jgi:hypothetical protein
MAKKNLEGRAGSFLIELSNFLEDSDKKDFEYNKVVYETNNFEEIKLIDREIKKKYGHELDKDIERIHSFDKSMPKFSGIIYRYSVRINKNA